jgi:hypothetical protein
LVQNNITKRFTEEKAVQFNNMVLLMNLYTGPTFTALIATAHIDHQELSDSSDLPSSSVSPSQKRKHDAASFDDDDDHQFELIRDVKMARNRGGAAMKSFIELTSSPLNTYYELDSSFDFMGEEFDDKQGPEVCNPPIERTVEKVANRSFPHCSDIIDLNDEISPTKSARTDLTGDDDLTPVLNVGNVLCLILY